ncbi:rod shape-determining protein RodA [candidate division TA06 bacterium]|uniref:Peptidoglycan glycosyltransferase RodA n=1 Tax=candidate division TA06 bacterium TaxID=2250710 RepID=A0A933I9D3_UNCT6|nr:rod shape-determining protein RodA [candidate division TA06 bacterium]
MKLKMLGSRDFDLQMVIAVFALCAIGIMAIYSATQIDQPQLSGLWQKQLFSLGLGLLLLVIMMAVPFRYFEAFAWPLYIVSMILLLAVLFAPPVMKAHRWINFGFVRFQPSELAKPATIFVLAKILSAHDFSLDKFWKLLVPIGAVLLPAALVLVEPDLGTSLSFAALFLTMVFWHGLSFGNFFFMVSPVLSMVAVVSMPSWIGFMALMAGAFWFFRVRFKYALPIFLSNIFIGSLAPAVWYGLKSYQRKRLLTFINPDLDPKGAGWHVLQSKIAVGSGGVLGKGFLRGTQKKLSFLPEQHTDFIFSTFAEEFGFIGVLIVLLLFFWLLFRGIIIARQARNRFASFTAIGIIAVIGFHVFLNIGVTLGIMPVTGIPLPFLSYGGTSLITMLVMTGILLNIGLRRYEY